MGETQFWDSNDNHQRYVLSHVINLNQVTWLINANESTIGTLMFVSRTFYNGLYKMFGPYLVLEMINLYVG